MPGERLDLVLRAVTETLHCAQSVTYGTPPSDLNARWQQAIQLLVPMSSALYRNVASL